MARPSTRQRVKKHRPLLAGASDARLAAWPLIWATSLLRLPGVRGTHASSPHGTCREGKCGRPPDVAEAAAAASPQDLEGVQSALRVNKTDRSAAAKRARHLRACPTLGPEAGAQETGGHATTLWGDRQAPPGQWAPAQWAPTSLAAGQAASHLATRDARRSGPLSRSSRRSGVGYGRLPIFRTCCESPLSATAVPSGAATRPTHSPAAETPERLCRRPLDLGPSAGRLTRLVPGSSSGATAGHPTADMGSGWHTGPSGWQRPRHGSRPRLKACVPRGLSARVAAGGRPGRAPADARTLRRISLQAIGSHALAPIDREGRLPAAALERF